MTKYLMTDTSNALRPDSRNLTIAIPSYENPEQLRAMLLTLVRDTDFLGRIIVINNGGLDYESVQAHVPYEIDWIDSDTNLGWAGAINTAIEHTQTGLFCMANDDLVFPCNRQFWENLCSWFHYINVGGVGPVSNYASAYQSLHLLGMPDSHMANVLIGFLAIYRTDWLKKVGGLDASLPGGDDYDLSIRAKNDKYKLVVDRRSFVFHHGSQTGRRVYEGYWDSQPHQLEVANAVMAKHGVRKWYQALHGRIKSLDNTFRLIDLEAKYNKLCITPTEIHQHLPTLRSFASGCRHITEFGTDDGTSTTAFLTARPEKMVCYDIVHKPEVDELAHFAKEEGIDFKFVKQDVLKANIDPTDLLFVDDLHTYDQVKAELGIHADKVRKYILFHDTQTMGFENNGDKGIRPAIDEFLRERDEWRIVSLLPHNNGLMALARVQ